MKIALVIPVKDEAHSIWRLLGSISSQTRLPDEVIFVDAGSTDATKEILTDYKDSRLRTRVLSIGPAYPGTARNAGVKASSYELIAFTDGGIELDKDWLSELCKTMQNDVSADVVYGNYNPRTDTLFEECLALAVVPPLKRRSRFIASSLLKKPVWQAIGGFPDLRAAEDRIFMEEIEKKAYRVRYNPNASVVWDIPCNLKSVFDRFSNYSYHDLKAGRTRDWHIPVLKMYLSALVCIYLGLSLSPIFFWLMPPAFTFRVARKILINKDEPYFNLRFMPVYFIITGFLILFVDAAMLAGWVRYLSDNRRQSENGRVR